MAEAPRELLADPDLPWHGKACGAVLWAMVRRDDADPQWWQTFAELGERLGCTERQARRAHGELVKRGWAERRRHGHVFRTHLFRERAVVAVALQPATPLADTARLAVSGCPPGGKVTAREAGNVESPDKPRISPELIVGREHIALVAEPDIKPEPIRQKRRRAAGAVWDAHERKRVDRGIGRPAKGGGLRKARKQDLDAIVRCAAEIQATENVEEKTAWKILRDAALAAVDAAADAAERGDEFADKLKGWRATNPFGGKKLGPMLQELERRQHKAPTAMSRDAAKAWAEAHDGRAPKGWQWTPDFELEPAAGDAR